jgi:hypothetical protein
MRTAETCLVEEVLRKAGFGQVDSYRYNSATIRVRVVDRRFEGLSHEKRVDMVQPHLAQLPERTEADIIALHVFTPSELREGPGMFKEFLNNAEFEDPSRSAL